MKSTTRISWFRVTATVALVALFVLNFGLMSVHAHFGWLAESFWHGRLDIPQASAAASVFIDIAEYGGAYYWPLPIGPAIVLMPFVLFFDATIAQVMAQVFVVAGLAFLAYRIAVHRGLAGQDARWLALAFLFGSVAVGVVMRNTPWVFANALSALCLMAALDEYAGEARPWRMGTFAAAAFLMRFTAGVGALFFGVAELLSARPFKERLVRAMIFALPMVIAIGITGLYNQARFGDAFETGHAYHRIVAESVRESFDVGMFGPQNIARNARFYFFELPTFEGWVPVVSPYGVSVFLLSPIFLWVIFMRKKDPETIATLLTTGLALAVFMMYFTTGFWQFGPRYLLDVLPFWYILLVQVFVVRGFHRRHRAIIAGSVFLNIALLTIFLGFHLTMAGLPPIGIGI